MPVRIDLEFNPVVFFCAWWRVATNVVETRVHIMIQWYFASFDCQNFPFVSMEAIFSMFYFVSLMSINSANPSKNIAVLQWNANAVTIAPVDVLTRQGISSPNGEPELIFTKNLYMSIILNMAVLWNSTNKNDVWELGLAGMIPYLKGLIIIHCVLNCTLVLLALVVALTTKATSHNQ